MKVSVIIPTYKRSGFLIRAIQSVYDQDYKDFEVIVIDDNGVGKDFQKNNLELLKKFSGNSNFSYYAMPQNGGACKARNKGAELSSSTVLMFLDDDDYYLPNKISRQIEVLQDPAIDACLCAMRRIDDNEHEIISKENFPRGKDLKSYILDGNCFTTMIAIRKSVFDSLDGFSEISRFQDKYFMYKFYENNFKSFLLQEQLFVLSEHNDERVSLGSITKVTEAYYQLFDFEKKHFNLFDKNEIKAIHGNFYFNLAKIRTGGKRNQRFQGLKFLFKSRNIFKHKILLRLLLSDHLYQKLKKWR
ncbi:MAG: glycosyltransferase family 2 protein [Flavobacterium sp.]